jgi:hypothetical protein
VERDRDALAALDRQREQVMAEWRALVAEGDRSAARIVLAEVERIDAERGAQAAARRLEISPRTHGPNILAKLGVHPQLQVVLFRPAAPSTRTEERRLARAR